MRTVLTLGARFQWPYVAWPVNLCRVDLSGHANTFEFGIDLVLDDILEQPDVLVVATEPDIKSSRFKITGIRLCIGMTDLLASLVRMLPEQ